MGQGSPCAPTEAPDRRRREELGRSGSDEFTSSATADDVTSGDEFPAHAQEVRESVEALHQQHGWDTDLEVEEALAAVDFASFRKVLRRRVEPEPRWDEAVHGAFLEDSRVQRLAEGGFVFEDVGVYAVLVQLLCPAISRELRSPSPPRVLDVGCGTGFLTAVLARLVAPRGGCVVAIDVFIRQVEHAQRTLSECCPELLPYVHFVVADGLDYRDPRDRPFDAIAVGCQAEEVPESLIRMLAPGGRLVAPVGSRAPKGPRKAGLYRKYWLVEKGPGGSIAFSGRAGPIGVNFLPMLPAAPCKAQLALPAGVGSAPRLPLPARVAPPVG